MNKGLTGWLTFAVVVLVIVAIAFRIDFVKNLVFGTTTATVAK